MCCCGHAGEHTQLLPRHQILEDRPHHLLARIANGSPQNRAGVAFHSALVPGPDHVPRDLRPPEWIHRRAEPAFTASCAMFCISGVP
jgi:hypothetical protein